MEITSQILFNGLLATSSVALIAAGLSFLYSTSRIFHLAHGVVAAAAGYIFFWLWRLMDWPWVLALTIAVLGAAALGVLMNEVIYEPLRRRGTRGLGYLIATLALLTLGSGILLALFGASPRTFRFQTATVHLGPIYATKLQLINLAITALLLFVFWIIVQWTTFGKAMRATADNEMMAELLGVNTKRIRRTAFALASVLAAAAGIMTGLEFSLDPNMATLLAVKGFAGAVIGGIGSFFGTVIGSAMIGFGEQVVVWFWGAGWRSAVTFVLLFIFLLFRPRGLFGVRRDV